MNLTKKQLSKISIADLGLDYWLERFERTAGVDIKKVDRILINHQKAGIVVRLFDKNNKKLYSTLI